MAKDAAADGEGNLLGGRHFKKKKKKNEGRSLHLAQRERIEKVSESLFLQKFLVLSLLTLSLGSSATNGDRGIGIVSFLSRRQLWWFIQ